MSAEKQPIKYKKQGISLKDKPFTLATSLALAGALLTALAFWVLRSTPLASLGISTILIGAVAFAVARGQPKIPPQASAILLQSGVENISAIIEELGLKSKAVYLPSSISGDKPKALIPLDSNFELSKKVLPNRLIVKYGSDPESVGLLVTTPGSGVGSMVEAKPECSAGDLQTSLSIVLSGAINLADSAQVKMDGDKVLVEVVNPRLESNRMWVYECLGTPIAAIVASVIAEVLDKPVSINSERTSKGKCVVDLKIVGRSI